MKRSLDSRILFRPASAIAICLLLLLAPVIATISQSTDSPTEASPAPDAADTRVFRLYYDTPADFQAALASVGGFDVLGVDTQEKFAAVTMSNAGAGELRRLGYRVAEDRHTPQRPNAWSSSYYTYDRVKTDLEDLAARYSSLATLYDLGPTWETVKSLHSRRIWAMRIAANPDGKPQVLFVANEHAREIATTEIAMRLVKHLLENYGRDAEATFLVDNRDVWVVPMANPDGHARVEQGWSMKRKNANTDNGSCGEPGWGVDINRNFPYMWGLVGYDAEPCSETYRGSSALAEPETQAIMNLVNANSFTFLMDYHSFGNLILYPWGYTTSGPPVDMRLPAIGAKLSRLTARSGTALYTPEPGSWLYLTSGNSLDWSYATKNVLAYTTEIGSYYDWFDPPYARIDAFWEENRPAALYLLNVADNPSRVYGPEAQSASVVSARVGSTAMVTFNSTFSDIDGGGQVVAAAEYFVDSPGADGTGTPMAPLDGAFDSSTEVVQATILAATLLPGRHMLLARGRDSAGNWGSLSAVFVNVTGPYQTYFPSLRLGVAPALTGTRDE